jgi:hypothetical protein
MKPDQNRLTAEFAPETRFELRPAPPAPFRASLENEFERLKDQLLAEQLYLAKTPELYAPLRRAANEAAALAWSAFFPFAAVSRVVRGKNRGIGPSKRAAAKDS